MSQHKTVKKLKDLQRKRKGELEKEASKLVRG